MVVSEVEWVELHPTLFLIYNATNNRNETLNGKKKLQNFTPALTEHENTAYNSITLTFHLYETIVEQDDHFHCTECRMEETGQARH